MKPACYLFGIRTVEELETHYARGHLFENFVINEVMKFFQNRGERQPLYFWRDKTGHEIDLLIDLGGKIYPLEIKSGQTVQSGFFKNLSFFNRIADNEVDLSTVIYAGDLSQSRSKGNVRGWQHIIDKRW